MVVEPLLGPGVATSLFLGHDGLGTDGGKHHGQTAAFSTDDDGSSDVVAIGRKLAWMSRFRGSAFLLVLPGNPPCPLSRCRSASVSD